MAEAAFVIQNKSGTLAPGSMQSPFSNQPAFGARSNDARFSHQRYIIKRKALQLVGATLYLYDLNEQLIMWGKRQGWKFFGDLQFFTDENQTQELIRLVARPAEGILAGKRTYDVFDPATNTRLGAFQRDNLQSGLVRDTWSILDLQDQPVGQVLEDSTFLSLLRRYVEWMDMIFPQRFHATLNGVQVALYSRHRNFFSSRMDIDFSSDTAGALDRRMGLAMAMLLEAIESKR